MEPCEHVERTIYQTIVLLFFNNFSNIVSHRKRDEELLNVILFSLGYGTNWENRT